MRNVSAGLGASLLFLAGCATTQVAIKEHVSFAKYTRVYLQDFEEDPRHVVPKTAERLRQLGFEVVLTEKDEPVGGRQGTGFLISAGGLVVTSAHVIGKKPRATIWVDGKRYEATVVPNRGTHD
jgi:S1-C subfamily serine protease